MTRFAARYLLPVICCLMFVCCLLSVPSADAANVVRAFTALTGGGTGALDKIPKAEIADGDIGIVVVGNASHIYQYNAASTQADDGLNYIRPDDYATAGVWHLVTNKAAAFTASRSPTPTVNFWDSDTADAEIDAKIYANCTTLTSNLEDCDLYLQTMTGGSLTTKLHLNSTGLADFQAGVVTTTGEMTGGIKVLPVTASCTIGSNCDGTSVRIARGGIVWVTVAATVTLPEIVASPSATQVGIGAGLCIATRDAGEALVVDPHANDSITLDGTKGGAGKYVTATGAGAEICLVAVELDNWKDRGKAGTWTAEP